MPENDGMQDPQDKTSCGCKADDANCYCDENGKKKFRKPSND